MTNWKKFKITDKQVSVPFNMATFVLDDYFHCALEVKGSPVDGAIIPINYLHVWNNYPFNICEVGDYLEIDVDKARASHKTADRLKDTSMVRKFGSSAVVPSSSSNQQITSNQIQERDERMRRWVEESGGEYEVDFIARQEYRDNGKISANELKWTYRKK